MKRRLATVGLALVVILVTAGLTSAGAQQPVDGARDGLSTRTVSTVGLGEVRVQPDMAVVELGVQVEAETAEDALNQANEDVQAVLDALRGAGVAEEDIQTRVVQLNPRQELPPGVEGGQPELTGFNAINIVQVQVRELEQLGQLITTAVEAGANVVQRIGFQVSDPVQVREQAMEQAFDDARTQAETLASLAEAGLGEVLAINSQSISPVRFETAQFGIGGGGAVPIVPGQESVTAQIQVTWQLDSGTQAGDEEGSAAGELPSDLPPEAALEAQSALAERLGVDTEDVEIISAEQMDWPNACLGLAEPNELCAEVITPGWLIMLRVDDTEYEVHTDEQGGEIRFADL